MAYSSEGATVEQPVAADEVGAMAGCEGAAFAAEPGVLRTYEIEEEAMNGRPLNSGPLILLTLWACIPSQALPCSVTHIATPGELVKDAEAIVRARVVEHASGATSTAYRPVTLQVVERLKGSFPASTFSVLGYTNAYEGSNGGKAPYRFVRQGGQHGNCFAHDYKVGAEFLFFLRDGTPYWAALAPVNEEVRGADDPWVVWVKQATRETP